MGRTPEIQLEAPVIELAKLFDDSFAMLIEIGLQTFPATDELAAT